MEKILIADDEVLIRQLVIDFLKPEGYEIIEAGDGKEALEKDKKEKTSIIVSAKEAVIRNQFFFFSTA